MPQMLSLANQFRGLPCKIEYFGLWHFSIRWVTIGFVRRSNLALGRVIARLREAAGISQEELAERAGVHRTYISQLERGIKSPTLNILVEVSGALGVRASELVRLTEEEADGLPRP